MSVFWNRRICKKNQVDMNRDRLVSEGINCCEIWTRFQGQSISQQNSSSTSNLLIKLHYVLLMSILIVMNFDIHPGLVQRACFSCASKIQSMINLFVIKEDCVFEIKLKITVLVWTRHRSWSIPFKYKIDVCLVQPWIKYFSGKEVLHQSDNILMFYMPKYLVEPGCPTIQAQSFTQIYIEQCLFLFLVLVFCE